MARKDKEYLSNIVKIYLSCINYSEVDDNTPSDDDTDPEVSFSPKSAASILSAGAGAISVLKSSAMSKCVNRNRYSKNILLRNN